MNWTDPSGLFDGEVLGMGGHIPAGTRLDDPAGRIILGTLGAVTIAPFALLPAPEIIAALWPLAYSPLAQKIVNLTNEAMNGFTPTNLPANAPQAAGFVAGMAVDETSPLREAVDRAMSPSPAGGASGGESGGTRDNGCSSSFSASGNSFTTAEGGSAFGFNVDLTQAGQNAYQANPTGNPAGQHPDSISRPQYPAGKSNK